MSYPLVIKDNFFPDADSIFEFCNKLDLIDNPSYANYPGDRASCLSNTNKKLYLFISQKIFHILHDKLPSYYRMDIEFQKIYPFVKDDKWDRKNRGWVHTDKCLFGGVIYLDKNPDKDAGTSIYKSKDGFDVPLTHESQLVKEKNFAGGQIYDEEYNKAYDVTRNQYEEILRIPIYIIDLF